MEPYDSRTQRNGAIPGERSGAILELHPDGSVTLYGLEDVTDVHDVPVLEIRDSASCEKAGDGAEPGPDERRGPTS